MAEKVKETLAYSEKSNTHETSQDTGREAGKAGLNSFEIGSSEISKALEMPINTIVDLIHEALDNGSVYVKR